MAKVWFVFDGADATVGDAAAELSVRDCVERLGLQPGQRMRLPDGERPRFGKLDAKRDWARGPQHVVVEITDEDGTKPTEWSIGFYRLPIKPAEAHSKLNTPPR